MNKLKVITITIPIIKNVVKYDTILRLSFSFLGKNFSTSLVIGFLTSFPSKSSLITYLCLISCIPHFNEWLLLILDQYIFSMHAHIVTIRAKTVSPISLMLIPTSYLSGYILNTIHAKTPRILSTNSQLV